MTAARAAAAIALLAAACSSAGPRAETAGDVSAQRVIATPAPASVAPSAFAPGTPGALPRPDGVDSGRAAVHSPRPPATPSPHACTPPACFDAGEAMRHTRALSVDIGVRDAGSDGDRRAADYLEAELSRLGYATMRQPIRTPIGAESSNVLALPRGMPVSESGSPEPDGRYLIVGAHRDTVPGSPGGNDNATGTAAVIEIARALTGAPAQLPVVFVLFGAEERQPNPEGGTVKGHIGSQHYVNAMSPRARANLVAMLNLDMIGYGTRVIAGKLDARASEATERLVRIARGLNIPITSSVEGDRSDNGPFVRAGMNAGWVWSGRDPAYHSPRDTYDHVQPESVNRNGALILAAARSYR